MIAIIVCNGNPPYKRLFKKWIKGAHIIIAADGGAATSLKLGVRPDYIIGDMDSFSPPSPHNLIIIHDEDQETNDLQKALALAKKLRVQHVRILGATGYRTDHTLKNLSVLQQFTPSFEEICLLDNDLKYQVIPQKFTFKTKPGKQVSLFPLSGKVDGIVTDGLLFPLQNEALENGKRDGSSNETVATEVTIEHENGCLLLMTAH